MQGRTQKIFSGGGGKTPFEELFGDILYRKVYTFGILWGAAAPLPPTAA